MPSLRPDVPIWQERLYAFMTRNAVRAPEALELYYYDSTTTTPPTLVTLPDPPPNMARPLALSSARARDSFFLRH